MIPGLIQAKQGLGQRRPFVAPKQGQVPSMKLALDGRKGRAGLSEAAARQRPASPEWIRQSVRDPRSQPQPPALSWNASSMG